MSDKKCPRCGLWNTDSAMRCDCGYDFEQGIVLKPYCITDDSHVENLSPVEWINGGGPGIRLLARVIDLVVHYLATFIASLIAVVVIMIAAMVSGMSLDIVNQKMSEQTFFDFALMLLGIVLYHTVCEGLHGSTLGKLICGLVVIGVDGRPCSMGAAFGRNMAMLVDLMFFGLPAYASMSDTMKQQRIGDRWAKTIVVKRNDLEGIEALRSGSHFAIAFFAGVMLDGILAAMAQWIKFAA